MDNIFEDLYDGKICPNEQHFKAGSPYAKALHDLCKLDLQLKGRLNQEALELYNQLAQAYNNLTDLLEKESFQTGMRLGLRMGHAAFEESENFIPVKNDGQLELDLE